MMMDSRDFLEALGQPGGDKLVRLATVKTAPGGGVAAVRFDGDANDSGGTFKALTSYTPVIGNRVVMLKTGGSYVILGAV